MVVRVKFAAMYQTSAQTSTNIVDPRAWMLQFAKHDTISLFSMAHDSVLFLCNSPVHYEPLCCGHMYTEISTPTLVWTISSLLTSICNSRGSPSVGNSYSIEISDDSVHIASRKRATDSQQHCVKQQPLTTLTTSTTKRRRPVEASMKQRQDLCAGSKRPRSEDPARDHKRHRSETSIRVLEDKYRIHAERLHNCQHILRRHLNCDLETCKSLMAVTDIWTCSDDASTTDPSMRRLTRRATLSAHRRSRRSLTIGLADDYQAAREHINDLRRKKHRLEDIVRCAKEREAQLKGQLMKLSDSKSRTEKRLSETMEDKHSLENEVKSLINVNTRLADHLSEHHRRVNVVEEDQEDLAHRIELLQQERELLHEQLAESQRDNQDLRKLDIKHQNELFLKMRQTAAVENRLLAALDRFDALIHEHTEANCKSVELCHAQDQAHSRLEFAQSMLRAVEESAEGQRVRIEHLEEKERKLLDDIGNLGNKNQSLQRDLDIATTELIMTREALKTMNESIKASDDALQKSLGDVEKASKRINRLKKDLADSQKTQQDSLKQLQTLRSDLTIMTCDNAQLKLERGQLNQKLKDANCDKQRLEDVVESHAKDMKVAEDSFEALSDKFSAFVDESEQRFRQNELERQRLTQARNEVRDQLAIFDRSAQRLAEINISMQHVVNSFDVCQAPTSNTVVEAGGPPTASMWLAGGKQHTSPEADRMTRTFGLLQENISSLHTILTQLHMRREVDKAVGEFATPPISDKDRHSSSMGQAQSKLFEVEQPFRSKTPELGTIPEDPDDFSVLSPLSILRRFPELPSISEVDDTHDSWTSSRSASMACVSTPATSVCRVDMTTPLTDPFIDSTSHEDLLEDLHAAQRAVEESKRPLPALPQAKPLSAQLIDGLLITMSQGQGQAETPLLSPVRNGATSTASAQPSPVRSLKRVDSVSSVYSAYAHSFTPEGADKDREAHVSTQAPAIVLTQPDQYLSSSAMPSPSMDSNTSSEEFSQRECISKTKLRRLSAVEEGDSLLPRYDSYGSPRKSNAMSMTGSIRSGQYHYYNHQQARYSFSPLPTLTPKPLATPSSSSSSRKGSSWPRKSRLTFHDQRADKTPLSSPGNTRDNSFEDFLRPEDTHHDVAATTPRRKKKFAKLFGF